MGRTKRSKSSNDDDIVESISGTKTASKTRATFILLVAVSIVAYSAHYYGGDYLTVLLNSSSDMSSYMVSNRTDFVGAKGVSKPREGVVELESDKGGNMTMAATNSIRMPTRRVMTVFFDLTIQSPGSSNMCYVPTSDMILTHHGGLETRWQAISLDIGRHPGVGVEAYTRSLEDTRQIDTLVSMKYMYHLSNVFQSNTTVVPSSLGVWLLDNDTNPDNGVEACSATCHVTAITAMAAEAPPLGVSTWEGPGGSVVVVLARRSPTEQFSQWTSQQQPTRRPVPSPSNRVAKLNTDAILPWIYLVLAGVATMGIVWALFAKPDSAKDLMVVKYVTSNILVHSLILEILLHNSHALPPDGYTSLLLACLTRLNVLDSRNLRDLWMLTFWGNRDTLDVALEMLLLPCTLGALVTCWHVYEAVRKMQGGKADRFGVMQYGLASTVIRWELSLLLVLVVFLPLCVSRLSLALLPCAPPDQTGAVLHMSGMLCSSSRFILLRWAAVLFAFLLPVCVLGSITALLWNCRNSFMVVIDNPDCERDALLTYSAFLYRSYTSPNFFWASVELATQLLVAAARSTMTRDGVQTVPSVIVCVVGSVGVVNLVIHAWRQPHAVAKHNTMSVVSHVVVLAVVLLFSLESVLGGGAVDILIAGVEAIFVTYTVWSVV